MLVVGINTECQHLLLAVNNRVILLKQPHYIELGFCRALFGRILEFQFTFFCTTYPGAGLGSIFSDKGDFLFSLSLFFFFFFF